MKAEVHMKEESASNKKAWEYRTYEYWLKSDGPPENRAKVIMENPLARLKKHSKYFQNVKDFFSKYDGYLFYNHKTISP